VTVPLFRRRRDGSAYDEEAAARDDDTGSDDGGPELDGPGDDDYDEADAVAEPPRPQGPWDAADLPAEDAADRVDLGALRVQVPEGVELRVDLDPQGAVTAATLVRGEEVMQLGVFAAPRTEPIWDEVRDEIAQSLRSTGGAASEVAGAYGTELHARIPTEQPGVFAPARFVGVNGPRWFLRALVSGPRAAAGEDDPALAAALRGVVVVRGPDAMPPREALPLRLPKEAQASAEQALAEQATAEQATAEQATAAQAAGEAAARTPGLGLPPPERGPEITETR